MRRKGLKVLGVTLTASVLLSLAGTGSGVYAAGADSAAVEALEKQGVLKGVLAAEAEDSSQEEELNVTLEAVDSDLVSSVITDQNLLNAVLSAYNTGNGSSVAASEFTYAMLRAYTETLDLSTATNVTTIPQEAFYKCN